MSNIDSDDKDERKHQKEDIFVFKTFFASTVAGHFWEAKTWL